jgi:hypothetical protein
VKRVALEICAVLLALSATAAAQTNKAAVYIPNGQIQAAKTNVAFRIVDVGDALGWTTVPINPRPIPSPLSLLSEGQVPVGVITPPVAIFAEPCVTM